MSDYLVYKTNPPHPTEYVLCQDGRWRSFYHYGTTPGCVKEYTTMGRMCAAMKRRGIAQYSFERVYRYERRKDERMASQGTS